MIMIRKNETLKDYFQSFCLRERKTLEFIEEDCTNNAMIHSIYMEGFYESRRNEA